MEAPKCRYCGHRHWLSEGHVGASISQNKVSATQKVAIRPSEKAERLSKAKFDRTAYQREYMKKWRIKHGLQRQKRP